MMTASQTCTGGFASREAVGRTGGRKPEWLKVRLPSGDVSAQVSWIIHENGLHTVCDSALCPNRGECWGRGTATFLICGDVCTRSCRFCNVITGRPASLDPDEPQKIAHSVKLLQLKHAVITSVDRDDLPDLGVTHWVRVIEAVKYENPTTTMETLIPDFQGRNELIDKVIAARPEIISHNMETVSRLTKSIRSSATYNRSLDVINRIAASGVAVAKSGLMLGLGERHEEVIETMQDLRNAGCSVLTIGQYLRPSAANIAVAEYIHPDVFEQYRLTAVEMGFTHVESAPLVRSSYHAEKHIKNK